MSLTQTLGKLVVATLGPFVELFSGDTPEKAYARARSYAYRKINECQGMAEKEARAQHLYIMASGGFNTTASHRAFDKGINDALNEMGFESDY